MKNKDEFAVLRQIADRSNEGMILYEIVPNKIMYANAIATKICSLSAKSSPAEIKEVIRYIAPPDKEYLKKELEGINETLVREEIEFRYYQPGEDVSFLCASFHLVQDASVLVIYLRDITRPKQHEDYLVEFGTKKNTILDTLTHHISGALNLMKNLSIEAEKYVDDSNANLKTYLTLVSENSKACLKIIDDFMKYEHEKSPTISIKSSRINIVEKINFVKQEIEHGYNHRKVYLYSSSKEIYINVDEVKLLQVINNLTSNSLKFSDASLPITIEIIDYAQEVSVSVSDKGIGIPEELKPFIFDRHSSASRSGLNNEASTGRGLSICKSLIELMGGRIWFESAAGSGTSFFISLPKE